MILAVTKVRFLGHEIWKGTITPITRSIEFAKKFPNEIKNKTQLQRFLGFRDTRAFYVFSYFLYYILL